jgi:hypothetical protein
MILMMADPSFRPFEGVSPENLNFLGPNGTQFAHCHFMAQKSLDFQDTHLPMTLVMGVASIKIITSRAI